MRPLDEWDRSDLQALVDGQVQEWLQLDYKASEALQNTDGKKAEIAKDVSAFANSAGGRIVYGIVEDKRYPVAIDAGSDVQKISKEWIENVILSGISPRVDGVRVKEVPISEQRVAYVVDIPQATSRAPHQAKDKRYYKRYEYQSVPMEDYEIKDIMRRASKPELVIWLSFSDVLYDDATDSFHAKLNAFLGNRSDEPAIYASVRIVLDTTLFSGDLPQFDQTPGYIPHVVEGRTVHLKQYSRSITPAHHLPLYREQPINLFSFAVRMRREVPFIFCYIATAPGFSRTKSFLLRSAKEIQALPDAVEQESPIPAGW